MESQKQRMRWLERPLQEVRCGEQTQQIVLPDGMPDIGKILYTTGQVILRSKEWLGDRASISGGMMVWVLYQPEDGSQEQILDAWVPFQLRWELPEHTPEGEIRVQCLPRFVDGRSVSPRKIMVRCGVSALGEAFSPVERLVELPENGAVELLERTYPVRLGKEAGERSFLLEEGLDLPDGAREMEKLLSFQVTPRVADQKVVGSKVVFRGTGNLHLLYRGEDGKLGTADFELPFSQFAELEGEYGPDAQADVALVCTSLELEMEEDGALRLKCALTAQYLITDKELLHLVEDGYSPTREVTLHREELELHAILETRRENLYGEQTIHAEGGSPVDVRFMPEFPRQQRQETGVALEVPGTFQVLYYGEDGVLKSATARWEGQQRLNADETVRIGAVPMAGEPQAIAGNGKILLKAEVPLELTSTARQTMNMVTGVEVGQEKALDPGRPSLILRRCGGNGLWDMAKETGSTREAIRKANGLKEEPAAGQMLLIPIS